MTAETILECELMEGRQGANLAQSLSSVAVVGLIDLTFSLAANIIFPRTVPKVEYASYRLFVLYAGYAGIFHLGLLDGLYLRAVGHEPQAVPSALVRRVGRALLLLQALGALIVLPILFRFQIPDASVALPILLVAIVVGTNFLTLYTYLLQATNNFVPVARVVGSARTVGALAAIGFIVAGFATASWLSVCLLGPVLVAVTLLRRRARRMPWADSSPARDGAGAAVLPGLWRQGATLFLGNLGITAALTVGTLFASLVLARQTFADYAFAAGLASLTVVGFEWLGVAAAPLHARAARAGLKSTQWEVLLLALMWLTPAVYWAAVVVVRSFLPAYNASLGVLAWLAAGLPFIGVLRTRAVTVCRALGRQDLALRLGGIGAPLILATVGAGWVFGHSTTWIAIGWTGGFAVVGSVVWLAVARSGRLPAFSIDVLLVCAAAAAFAVFLVARAVPNPIVGVAGYLIVGAVVVPVGGRLLVRAKA
jgi:hypothetical protein